MKISIHTKEPKNHKERGGKREVEESVKLRKDYGTATVEGLHHFAETNKQSIREPLNTDIELYI